MNAPQRVFAHVDMDAFYASIEIRDDPGLAGKPVVVGGPGNARGVVAAASYEARRFGVHSAMPMRRAEQLCPTLIRVAADFSKYRHVSGEVMEILRRYSPAVEPLSLDEAFLDLTGTGHALGTPRDIGRAIKQEIRATTRLTASVGIAPVKFVAKIASDYEKPDGLVVVEPDAVLSFLHPLPISRLWGVGPRTQASLEQLGIHTVGQLAAADRGRLERQMGDHGAHLHDLAMGRDEREVVTDWDAKSYSHEQTFARDQEDLELLESVLLDQSVRVARRLRRDHVGGRVVQIKIRFEGFQTITRQSTLPRPTSDPDEIYQVARGLFRENWRRRRIRLVGVGAHGIHPDDAAEPELFGPNPGEEKRKKLAEALDRIEDRFGRGKVTRAKILGFEDEVEGTGTPGDRDVE